MNRHFAILLAASAALCLAAALSGCGGGAGRTPDPTTGQVRGRVVDSISSPVAGATVKLAPIGNGAVGTGRGFAQTITGDDGSFSLTDVPAGTYTLTVQSPGTSGNQTSVVVTVTVPAGASIDVTVHIAAGIGLPAGRGAVVGRVVDLRTGAGVSNAVVQATLLPEETGIALMVTTDVNGRYVVDGLTPGIWQLQASKAHFGDGASNVQVAPDAISQMDLALVNLGGQD